MVFKKNKKPQKQIENIILETAYRPDSLLDLVNDRLKEGYRLYGNVIHWTRDIIDKETQVIKTTHIFSVYMIKEK